MKLKVKTGNFFIDKPNGGSTKELVKRSSKAVCGITERELTVKKEKLPGTIKKLERAGYYVIGTSYGKTPTKKVWFIQRGGL
jgi:hypothetical protein